MRLEVFVLELALGGLLTVSEALTLLAEHFQLDLVGQTLWAATVGSENSAVERACHMASNKSEVVGVVLRTTPMPQDPIECQQSETTVQQMKLSSYSHDLSNTRMSPRTFSLE